MVTRAQAATEVPLSSFMSPPFSSSSTIAGMGYGSTSHPGLSTTLAKVATSSSSSFSTTAVVGFGSTTHHGISSTSSGMGHGSTSHLSLPTTSGMGLPSQPGLVEQQLAIIDETIIRDGPQQMQQQQVSQHQKFSRLFGDGFKTCLE